MDALAVIFYGAVALGVGAQLRDIGTASWASTISAALLWPMLLGLVIGDAGDKAVAENWKRAGKARPR